MRLSGCGIHSDPPTGEQAAHKHKSPFPPSSSFPHLAPHSSTCLASARTCERLDEDRPLLVRAHVHRDTRRHNTASRRRQSFCFGFRRFGESRPYAADAGPTLANLSPPLIKADPNSVEGGQRWPESRQTCPAWSRSQSNSGQRSSRSGPTWSRSGKL